MQGFFLRLLEKDVSGHRRSLQGQVPLRSCLAGLKHYLANEWDKGHPANAAAASEVLALDALDAEARYASEPVDEMTPERLFERRGLGGAGAGAERLRDDYLGRGQGDLFPALEHLLVGGEAAGYRPKSPSPGHDRRGRQGGRPPAAPPLPRTPARGDRPDRLRPRLWSMKEIRQLLGSL